LYSQIGVSALPIRPSRNKRHGGSSPLLGFHPATPVLLRKTRPANGLWAKPGNSQGILASLRCSCSLRTAGAHSGGRRPHSIRVLVQPAKPKDRFTMAQRCIQFRAGLRLLPCATLIQMNQIQFETTEHRMLRLTHGLLP
jgi:hypothetical protein